ncbi:MAG: FAD-dependent oxidoreductase [Vicinamibacterales bacterium]
MSDATRPDPSVPPAPQTVDARDAGSLPGADTSADVAHEELMRLATEAAHQIKAPLATIQTILATLMGGFAGPLQPHQRWLVEKAVERCGHGTKIVRDLIKLRSLATIADDALRPLDLARAFSTVREAFRDAAAAKDVTLEASLEVPDPAHTWVRGEPDLVREVLSVLFDNAIKYTPRGGHVTARLRRHEPQNASGPVLQVEVVDTGIGIPPEGYAHLFQEFYRAPSARRASTEGSGLGLAFAFRAARRMGATVHLEPGPSGGVCARVTFPSCPPPGDLGAEMAGEHGAGGDAAPAPPPSRRVVIIGGVAAGPKVAAKVMRLDPHAEVTIVERGRFLAYSGCALPYYVSGVVNEQRRLLETALGTVRDSSFFHDLKNVRTLDVTEAISIDRQRKVVRVRSFDRGERDLPYDQLVLATGSRPVRPRIPGVDLGGICTLHGVPDAETLRAELRPTHVKDVVIVGAGLLGCQITEAIAMRGARLSLVEANPTILGVVDPLIGLLTQRHLESHGVRVLTGTKVVAFEGDGRVREVVLDDGRRLPCDFVVLAAGVRPEVALGEEAGLEIGKMGAFAVDEYLRTSDPDIFAAGDCAERPHLLTGQPSWFPGAAAAAIQGRIAAVNLCGGSEPYPGALGTIIIKQFDATVARTGLTIEQAREAGFDPVVAVVPGLDHAHFIPDAEMMVFVLMADRGTRRLLGAQVFGRGHVAKRIDIVATALAAGLSLDGLSRVSLAYAPHCAMATDVVVAAANVLRNKLDGCFVGISPFELRDALMRPEPPVLIDVRLPSELDVMRLPGSRSIPLGALRARLDELPSDRAVVLVCKLGLRSYEASLILKAHGLTDVRVLDGGLDAWPFELERRM